MKLLFLTGMLSMLFSFCFSEANPGTIKGRVVPYNAALHIWAVSDKDTVDALVQAAGAFELKGVKAGRYRVIAEGLRPYKVTTKPDVVVDGNVVDIGDIIL